MIPNHVRNDVKLSKGKEIMDMFNFNDYIPFRSFGFGDKGHQYSLAVVNAPFKVDRVYGSRQMAKDEMYRICDRYNLRIVKVYDDKHDKSYFTDEGAEFHINRLF